jgi:hypothetical protein
LFISECAFRQHLASVGGQRGDFGFTLAKRGGDVRQLCFRCGKITEIGSTCAMQTMPIGVDALTMLRHRLTNAGDPGIGARMLA